MNLELTNLEPTCKYNKLTVQLELQSVIKIQTLCWLINIFAFGIIVLIAMEN